MTPKIILVALAAALLPLTDAAAQAYPSKPVRLIVPFAAGGVTDVVARIVTPKLSEFLGQSMIVENRGGAGGTLGTAIGAKAAPDGYTLVLPAASHATTPSLYSRLPFDPLKDFTAVTQLVSVPYLLVVNPATKAQTVKELIEQAKAQATPLTFGSAGSGSSNHLAGELFGIMAGVKVTHVPYKGSGPALTDLMAGHIAFMFDPINTSLQHARSGRLKGLGVGTLKPARNAPGIPAISESGLPGFEATTWVGVLAPAGTPRDIVNQVQRAIVKVLAQPEVQERLSAQGSEPVGSTPEEFDAFVKSEIAKWGKVIRDAGVPKAE